VYTQGLSPTPSEMQGALQRALFGPLAFLLYTNYLPSNAIFIAAQLMLLGFDKISSKIGSEYRQKTGSFK